MKALEALATFVAAGTIAVLVKSLAARHGLLWAGICAAIPVNTVIGYMIIVGTNSKADIGSATQGTFHSLAATFVMICVISVASKYVDSWLALATGCAAWVATAVAIAVMR